MELKKLAKMLITNKQEAPSHGRGHRFNPYSAHHFMRIPAVSPRQYPELSAQQSGS